MQQKKALIIENDAPIRECIEVMYEAEGLAVISARDGQTGTHPRASTDLVVSDLYRVGLSGIDLFERLRADPRTGHIPCRRTPDAGGAAVSRDPSYVRVPCRGVIRLP